MSRFSVEVMLTTEDGVADVARMSADMARLAEVDGGRVESVHVYLWDDGGEEGELTHIPVDSVEET